MKILHRMSLLAATLAILSTSIGALAFANETDDRIESSAKKSYVFQKYLKDEDIKIESKEGIVTLTGTVVQEHRKALAQETVANLPGVKSVENRLESKGDKATENSDAWVTMNVQAALLFYRNLSEPAAEVQVVDGVVTLRGEAANKAQKDLTTEYVKDVTGVKSVNNEMTVASAPPKSDDKNIIESIDDASITALVKMTLMYHRSTSALHTKVSTDKQVVTVSGKAKNAAEKDLVTKVALDAYGVKSVVNNMTIAAPKSKKKVEGC
ncbi:MAG: BON domain-containing protein [Desulfobulbaceae bacterium]|nr:BON domain-containing protein [Desulfobulbaceae bacterium]